nr:manganese catalase family protein [Micromonospora sp. AMSO31t]
MFRHDRHLQFQAEPEKPDAPFAMKLQEVLGGQFGEMTVMMQYLWQGWTCRVPGKYKDMIMDIGTEEIGHVEMLTTMLARLLEGAPAETTEKAVTDRTPARLTWDAAEASDVIVTVGGGDACPVFPSKRHEDWALTDPAEQSLPVVRRVRDDIRARVEKLVDGLR